MGPACCRRPAPLPHVVIDETSLEGERPAGSRRGDRGNAAADRESARLAQGDLDEPQIRFEPPPGDEHERSAACDPNDIQNLERRRNGPGSRRVDVLHVDARGVGVCGTTATERDCPAVGRERGLVVAYSGGRVGRRRQHAALAGVERQQVDRFGGSRGSLVHERQKPAVG